MTTAGDSWALISDSITVFRFMISSFKHPLSVYATT
jgi:hypothetical protein